MTRKLCQFVPHGSNAQVCVVCGKTAQGRFRRLRKCGATGGTAKGWLRPVAAGSLCKYRGRAAGERQCGGCAGNVRLKVWECGKGLGLVTILDCDHCSMHSERQPPPIGERHRVLIRFWHGVGDHVQLSVVLRHLQAFRPEWRIDLGCHLSKFPVVGLVERLGELGYGHGPEREYHSVFDLKFPDPNQSYSSHPSTKAERCLLDIFGVQPIHDLCGYRLDPSPEAKSRIAASGIMRQPYVLIHRAGLSAPHYKNVSAADLAPLVERIKAAGAVPILLDLPTRQVNIGADCGARGINAPDPTIWGEVFPNADTILALAQGAQFCVGIDSGPGKLFAAAGAPTLMIWQRMHPVHYHGIGDRVLHSVPLGHEQLIKPGGGLAYFVRAYAWRERRRALASELPALLDEYLIHGLPGMGHAR